MASRVSEDKSTERSLVDAGERELRVGEEIGRAHV